MSSDDSDYNEDLQVATSTTASLRFITWNVDGLDLKNLKPRVEAVCKAILNEQADIVFLQEIIPSTAEYFRQRLTDYRCLFGNEYGYFVATFLKKTTVSYKGSQIIDFPNTEMMRNCLKINAVYKERNLLLFNSHLESTGNQARRRKAQLKQIFQEVLACPVGTTAIFAGDLNSRDKELREIGGLPNGIEDLWIACGSPKECEFFFDMTLNDNLIMPSNPRCRFDRIYVRHSFPRQLKPSYFGLIGLERLNPQRCFPSDHWGILSCFEVV